MAGKFIIIAWQTPWLNLDASRVILLYWTIGEQIKKDSIGNFFF
jgi:hypothetical protein